MAGKPPVFYWDSCVWLAWIKDEKRPSGEMEGVYSVVQAVDARKAALVASIMTKGEVFESTLTQSQQEKLTLLFKRSNVQYIDVTPPVVDRLAQLRQFYLALSKRDKRPPLCYADAIHLATAIVYDVAEFHTFDEKDNHGCRGLLGLDGNVGGHRLKVRRPGMPQLGFL